MRLNDNDVTIDINKDVRLNNNDVTTDPNTDVTITLQQGCEVE